jgi:catalase (peroxidase I)
MQQAVEQRIQALQAKLAITPGEMHDWNDFAQVMRDNASSTDQLFQQRAHSAATMTAVENMRSYAGIARSYADNTQKLADAFATFYGKLTPEQQKSADALFRAPSPATAAPHH